MSKPTKEDFWAKELEKPSLKEGPLKPKILWIKPLTIYHKTEFKQMDPRDYYQPQEKDAWDYHVWNIKSKDRGLCDEYFIDFKQCFMVVQSKHNFYMSASNIKQKYCWKPWDNYSHCLRK